MESYLNCLKLIGLFPRVIEKDWEIIDGRLCSKATKRSFGFLVLSVLLILLRIGFLALFFNEDRVAYAGHTAFDYLGSFIWDGFFLVCEFLVVLSVVHNNKKIKNYVNKVILLFHLNGTSKKQVKIPIFTKSIQNPLVGILLAAIGQIIAQEDLSFTRSVHCIVSLLSVIIFVTFCLMSVDHLAVLQFKLHSFNQTFLSKLQAHDLSDPNHILNQFLYKKTIKRTHIEQLNERKNGSFDTKRNPELLIHLRLQEVVDSLSREFMNAVGPSVLILMTSCIVSVTFGIYFLIKALDADAYTLISSGSFVLYAMYVVVAFISMNGTLCTQVGRRLSL